MLTLPFHQILSFRQFQIIRSLSTHHSLKPFAEPYCSKLDLRPFSCDWDSWSHYGFLDVNHGWYDLSEMEFFVRRVAKVPGTIRPLAFLDGVDPCIAFEADSKYYWLNTASSYLESFGGDFSSHDAFLLALTKPSHIDGAFSHEI
ncbi:hypothetical protein C8F01DRAFT_1368879 [Mycena amicta]|nr:hypothetical protein C8F01DRAFT_1368879 [Mycena amicta]